MTTAPTTPNFAKTVNAVGIRSSVLFPDWSKSSKTSIKEGQNSLRFSLQVESRQSILIAESETRTNSLKTKEKMKTLQIKKIETDTDFSSIEFAGGVETDGSDFDLEQLGQDIVFINSGFGCVMVSGTVTLKVGDSITDEFGGQPVIGTVRREAIHKNMSIVKESDYRAAFEQKQTGRGEK